MAPRFVLDPVRKQMKAKSWLINVKDMDHNFSTCETEAEEESMCNALGVIAGLWLKGDESVSSKSPTPWDPADGTDMNMHYDKEAQRVVWTGWTTPAGGPNKKGVTVQVSAADDTKLSFQPQI